MKKIFALGIALLTLASCNMDFYSSDSMTSTQIKENPKAAIYTTDGIYALFKDNLPYKGETGGRDGNYYLRHYFQLTETRGDNVTISGNSEDPFTQPYQYKDVDNTKNKTYTWWIAYKIIYAANSNISAIDIDSSDDKSLSYQLLGENYFFRAIAHFHMVTLFAMPYVCGRDNPGIVLRQGMDYSETKRSSVGECYDAVVEDLKKAIEYMGKGKARGDASYVNVTAAKALLARVYLYMGDGNHLQDCIDLCDDLISKAPDSVKGVYDVKTLQDYPKSTWTSDETIWCVHYVYPTDHPAPSATIGAMYNVTEESTNGWGEWYWSDELIELFNRYKNADGTSKDNRFAAYFTYPWYPEDVRLHNGKDMLCFPVKSYGNDFCVTIYTGGQTANPDGSYDLTCDISTKPKTKDVRTFHIVPETYNGFTRYFINENLTEDADFFNGRTPVYIREDVDPILGTRNGGYVRYYNTKWSWQDNQCTMTSPVMLRWGEVFLNRAEAYARKGGKDNEALADVNLIRKRAGLPDEALFTTGNMAASGYTNVLDVVLDERRMELCFEGHRVFDIFRNKKSLDRRYVGYHPFEVIDYDDPRIALLIPNDEILATPGFEQNNQSK
ncbi:MAG: RagB/SusD family nutrient uptake outer membrane protein [Bacteroidales bacterium]|nr:RagB/SusD family nutrient uptake outer membrane protein [Bacteroidales bacterium]